VTLARELMKKDVLIVETGCSAIACAKAGMLKPEAVYEFAGKGLIEICEAVGIPPILHLGSCVDISRVLTACAEMIKEGGIGHDFSDLPIAGAAPEWMSEKAVAIGHYVVATGGYTVLGNPLAIGGSPEVTKFLTEDIEEITGGKFAFEADPVKAAKLIIDHLDKKRTALNLKPMMYS
jgi:carbon-monoxide dehydrogenase catalytic subunit